VEKKHFIIKVPFSYAISKTKNSTSSRRTEETDWWKNAKTPVETVKESKERGFDIHMGLN